MERTQWLKDLKEGDEVAVTQGSFGYGYYTIETVKRITNTGRITTSNKNSSETKFDNRGREMGKSDSWTRKSEIMPITPEILEGIIRRDILRALGSTNFDAFKTDSLKEIYKIIQEELGSKEA